MFLTSTLQQVGPMKQVYVLCRRSRPTYVLSSDNLSALYESCRCCNGLDGRWCDCGCTAAWQRVIMSTTSSIINTIQYNNTMKNLHSKT